MIKAVLFDLDNTLILFEESKFFEDYSKKLYKSFADILPPDDFFQKLMKSTHVMVNNTGQVSNGEFFIRDFAKDMEEDKDKLWQRFENFYSTEFDQFEYLMKPCNGNKKLMETLQQDGYKIVIATNPMFPTNVQHIRLRWAGLDNFPFDLITSAENSSFCKPKLEYYQEICEKIQLKPEQCLMVGNDALNDIIASKIGMKTYLTTDSDSMSIELSRELAKNARLELPVPDGKGSLKDVYQFIQNQSN